MLGAKDNDRDRTSHKVFITRRMPAEALSIVSEAGHTVDMHDDVLPPAREVLLARSRGAAALVTLLSDRVDDELLEQAGPQLKVVANYAVGFDNIDVNACTRRGVVVANTPDVLTDATADQAFMLMLAVARRVLEGHELAASGTWRGWHPLQLLGREVSGRTLGIIGMGRIGTAVARRARGFGMTVIYHNRNRSLAAEQEVGAEFRGELERLLADSDFLSLHAPLSPETRHIIDAQALAQMPASAILVNTARGALVDEQALATALSEGRLWGAGLDVFEEEPRIHPLLRGLRNVVLAPHLGSATEVARRQMARLCGQAVVEVLAGRTPPNQVNRLA